MKEQLSKNSIQLKHGLGQNFISDSNLLKAIVKDADIQPDDNVLEIGAGTGTLTQEICRATAGKVISVEVDRKLQPILQENLSEYKNLELVFEDMLKIKPKDIKNWFSGQPFKVVANLPYYISTPILFYLLENDFDIKSITVMLQIEVAQRLSAKPSTKDYGALTILLEMLGNVTLTRKVPRALFTPQPKVDSAIVRMDIIPNKYTIKYKDIAPFIKASFMMRRKTLANNLMKMYDIDRPKFEGVCELCNIDIRSRAESLTCEQFISLYKQLNYENALKKRM